MDRLIYKFFPPPRYLRMPAFGIDISDRSMKYVELVESSGHLEVENFGEKILPPGVIKAGEIKDKDTLASILKEVFEKHASRGVVLSLPEEKAFVDVVTMPAMPSENLREALELQLEEHIPLNARQAIFDFEIIPHSGDSNNLDLVVVAFPKALVEDYRDVVRQAGLIPISFEMEAHALVRSALPKSEREPVMVVDFGRTRTSFIIVSEGVVRFTSTVTVAGAALDEVLQRIFKISPEEAERIKNEKGLVRTEENKEVFDALLPTISAIRDEISRHLIFWKEHAKNVNFPDPSVRKIYLCGGDSNLYGFKEYLSYELKLPIIMSNPWVNVVDFNDYIPEITYRNSLSYATALGLALAAIKTERSYD
ncbi:type IV pilus assembly protein PilM [Candidatus Giovannonibacteria bacterium]|nr:type IV pilus assembly protein PilM [Candidatus Giovannonibacteria bacterium]